MTQIAIAERLKIYAELASSSDAAVEASFMVSVVKSDISATLLVVVLWLSGADGVIADWCDYVADQLSGGVILTHLDGEDDRMHRVPSNDP